MRKDRIEERLADLEQGLRALKSEQKQGTEAIIMELKQFQEMLLEEKVAQIREELYRGYFDVTCQGYLAGASSNIEEALPDPCPMGKAEKCREVFRQRLETTASLLKEPGPTGFDGIVRRIAQQDEQLLGHLQTTEPCAQCYQKYGVEKETLVKVVQKLSAYRTSIASRAVDDYVRELPDDMVISSIVDPLSHKARFRMMKSLSIGSMSYKELTEATGYDGGHLIYHLNKLIGAGLAAKNETSGRYSITEKGIGVMDLVKALYYK
jgi:DNA-binding transcriptional ArsR family regulator